MIRKFSESDMDAVIDIWLSASIKAHNFVEASFWKSQVENMRNIYIPTSETYVFENKSKIVGFYSLNKNNLAAIFVSPESQGKGIGKQLMSHAKKQRATLTLSVYKENEIGYRFYLSQGFAVISKQTDKHTGHQEYTMSIGTS